LIGSDPGICRECFNKLSPFSRTWKIEGIPVRSLYLYHEGLRSLLYQYKGCFDIELADVFLAYQAPVLRWLYQGYTIVPAPSFAAKDEIRGFNHVELMFRCLKLPYLHALEKTDDVKQANNNYAERQRIGEHLHYVDGVVVAGKKILFVDDLFTTGATAKACCHLLREHGAKKVQILVAGYTPKATPEELAQEKENAENASSIPNK
jgi:competence protein ComFC